MEHPELRIGKVDPAKMQEDLDNSALLGPLSTMMSVMARTVDDTILVRLGDAWSQALDVYAAGQR